MTVDEVREGEVYESGTMTPELYVVTRVACENGVFEVRWLYLSGLDCGATYRTMLRAGTGWGDRRIAP